MNNYNFKNADEIKEFLNNIHIEYSYSCYSEHKPDGCHLLGDYFESVKRDFKKAASIYQNNCDNLDFPKSCNKFGLWSIVGKGCEKNLQQAMKYLKKSCTLNEIQGCVALGILTVSFPQIHNNNKDIVIEDGIKVLEKCCQEHNSEKACFQLSSTYISGIEDILERNMQKAYKYSLKACELGNYYACGNISQMHEKGEGVEKSPTLAETFRKKAADIEKEIKEVRSMEFGHGIKV
ncbi:PREDICTED: cytochrome c oxidase assembly factor 7 homolog [Ceratosolen solmsi marchali]|uniref:Cytochrome c oxidase assembly factor 7 homolog n=1 Tax=Ceratosolen solmsi marchali TaxID=326594 RepID=A0AAJ7E2A3_9HYME|nr:PREDICTED: cytochrome c oxidase assembly factor 7 homolog [Ceratosolen solmsi marchali]